MLLISWNVNGLRACIGKGFLDFFRRAEADIFCVQETKLQQGQISLELPGFSQHYNSAVKKGYSGTAVFSRKEPDVVANDFSLMPSIPDEPCFSEEGRLLTLAFKDFYLVNAYAPNAQSELKRLDTRMRWEDAFRAYVTYLDSQKPVVICGDLNVAHTELDIKNATSNRRNAGFTDEERSKFTELLSAGFADTFRRLYPVKTAYTWWSYMFNARANDVGWRIDYFLVSERLMPNVADSIMYSDVFGSDHCPVGIELKTSSALSCVS
ncbi:MAG: Exodeoxyribonuclease [Firmicutes bacterium ADurb.Bin182]|nr:MAG: Exodeoxyribonuclease [Firmicutes bacterium ADurb.Bin182]